MKFLTLKLNILLILIWGCTSNSNGWTDDQKSEIRKKIELDNFRKAFLTPSITQQYTDCCLEKITEDFDYPEIEQIDFTDTTESKARKIRDIRLQCWENMLKNNQEELKKRNIKTVFPD